MAQPQRAQEQQYAVHGEEGSQVGRQAPLDSLLELGVQACDIKTLKDVGITTVDGLISIESKGLCEIKDLSEQEVAKLKEIVRKCIYIFFSTGPQDRDEKRTEKVWINTGCVELNDIMGGGIETGSITVLIGGFRSGKTQICHMLCVTSQMHVCMGGGDGKVLYIDTEGSFRPQRLVQIAECFHLKPQHVLEDVAYVRARNIEEMQRSLDQAASMMANASYAVVIVDSATTLFRNEYLSRGELATRQNQLQQFLHALQHLAEKFEVAVVLTNQVVQDNLDGGQAMSMAPDMQLEAAGGNMVHAITTTRLLLRKGRGNTRIAKLIASPSLPEAEATFSISAFGVTDAME